MILHEKLKNIQLLRKYNFTSREEEWSKFNLLITSAKSNISSFSIAWSVQNITDHKCIYLDSKRATIAGKMKDLEYEWQSSGSCLSTLYKYPFKISFNLFSCLLFACLFPSWGLLQLIFYNLLWNSFKFLQVLILS